MGTKGLSEVAQGWSKGDPVYPGPPGPAGGHRLFKHLIADGTSKFLSGRPLEWECLGTLLAKGSTPTTTPGLWALGQTGAIIYSSKRREKVSSVGQLAPRG